MSTGTQEEKKAPEKPPIAFPLFTSLPCLYWPKGVRAGEPKPATMLRRSGNDHITVVEICAGQNKRHDNLRHVDDPYLQEHPAARNLGAWDYAEGFAYDFSLPKSRKR